MSKKYKSGINEDRTKDRIDIYNRLIFLKIIKIESLIWVKTSDIVISLIISKIDYITYKLFDNI